MPFAGLWASLLAAFAIRFSGPKRDVARGGSTALTTALVREGYYANRTDFIRTAIRNQLNTHAEAVRQTVTRKTLVLGLQHYTRRDLEAVRAADETLEIKVLGLASIADDVPPELALATIDSVVVLGAFRASPAVKATLADRIKSS